MHHTETLSDRKTAQKQAKRLLICFRLFRLCNAASIRVDDVFDNDTFISFAFAES